MHTYRIIKIITKSFFGDIHNTEKIQLNQWLEASEENKGLYSRLKSSGKIIEEYDHFEEFEKQKKTFLVSAGYKENNRIKNFRKIIIGSISVAAVAVCLLFLFPLSPVNKYEADSVPVPILGSDNKATLILSTGEIINIEEKQGHISDIGKIISNDGKQLIYSNSEQSAPSVINILKIPVGSTFNVTLSDGSEIMLNSHSEIKYPVSFGNDKREIFLNGEAYFNIAADPTRPFIIHCPFQSITVLGTQFNVEAYSGDPQSITTLVKGSVQIESGKSKVVIHPGIVAISDGKEIHTMPADTDFYTSWINNRFAFHDEPLTSILKKFERWYDIKFDVENPTTMAGKNFTGYIPRYKNIGELLELLEISMNITFVEDETRVRVTLNDSEQ